MAQSATRVRGPESEEAFLADRQRFWLGFTSATMWAVIGVAILLILLTVFLV
jgi:hypothetical protein